MRRVPAGATATLNNVTLNGNMKLSGSDLNVKSGLSGTGTVSLSNSARLTSFSSTQYILPILLNSGLTVRGTGGNSTIGDGSIGDTITNHGTIESIAGTMGVLGTSILSDGTLSIHAGSTMLIGGDLSLGQGGVLSMDFGGALQALLTNQGDLDLSGEDTLQLDALTTPGGPILIATYGGILRGTFDHVPHEFSLDYATPHKIYATYVPEPVVTLGPLSLLLSRGKRKQRR